MWGATLTVSCTPVGSRAADGTEVLSDSSYPLGASLGPKKASSQGTCTCRYLVSFRPAEDMQVAGHGDSRRLSPKEDLASPVSRYV